MARFLRSILAIGLLAFCKGVTLDASVKKKKGDPNYLLRSTVPSVNYDVEYPDNSGMPPEDSVDWTVAKPPVVNNEPYSSPVWVSNGETNSSLAQSKATSSNLAGDLVQSNLKEEQSNLTKSM
eukprot:CAMPEP_0197650824 /NCGR_PEP_ID=MMETSP1338-20131121/31177_1 /TAXON_ID=43686 ORGANISM="Pelagodinium beii, Strain RCC1491" /NCGR_SAMPLE_ID=MMETSP1338 /ASSEMBLY_ACC=CAM_ASM_000754 /LENGTH=122 /DNA_ID=CAMNT_0043225307 /DNA_START=42 /DNA_END=410 /DNA_ORIENTATION=-